jgi:hypothetical protein
MVFNFIAHTSKSPNDPLRTRQRPKRHCGQLAQLPIAHLPVCFFVNGAVLFTALFASFLAFVSPFFDSARALFMRSSIGFMALSQLDPLSLHHPSHRKRVLNAPMNN